MTTMDGKDNNGLQRQQLTATMDSNGDNNGWQWQRQQQCTAMIVDCKDNYDGQVDNGDNNGRQRKHLCLTKAMRTMDSDNNGHQ